LFCHPERPGHAGESRDPGYFIEGGYEESILGIHYGQQVRCVVYWSYW